MEVGWTSRVAVVCIDDWRHYRSLSIHLIVIAADIGAGAWDRVGSGGLA